MSVEILALWSCIKTSWEMLSWGKHELMARMITTSLSSLVRALSNGSRDKISMGLLVKILSSKEFRAVESSIWWVTISNGEHAQNSLDDDPVAAAVVGGGELVEVVAVLGVDLTWLGDLGLKQTSHINGEAGLKSSSKKSSCEER